MKKEELLKEDDVVYFITRKRDEIYLGKIKEINDKGIAKVRLKEKYNGSRLLRVNVNRLVKNYPKELVEKISTRKVERDEILNEMNYIFHNIKDGSATEDECRKFKYLESKLYTVL